MEKLKKILEDTIFQIEVTANLFYQQKNQEGFSELEKIISYLSDITNEVRELELKNIHINIEVDKMNRILIEAMNALEEQDTTLLSDILNYELKEMLDEYQDSII